MTCTGTGTAVEGQYRNTGTVTADAPGLGEHTDEVLTGIGFGDRIEDLRAAKIVF